ncbi:hypothetical protein [Xanthomonas sp. 60]
MMMHSRAPFSGISLLTALVVAGCGMEPQADASAPTADTSPATVTAPSEQNSMENSTSTEAAATANAPTPERVLHQITDVEGNGKLSYEISNGSHVNWWHGLTFEAAGKTFYTGFAWTTPNKYGAARQSGAVDPNGKATLAHATYTASASGSENPWTLVGSESWIGEFGHAERGNSIDGSRKAVQWNSPSGKFILAQPSVVTKDGQSSPAFEVLVFNPGELQGTEDRKWRHLGTLSGQTLELVPDAGSDMPLVRVKGGSTEGGDKPHDYRYDSDNTTYRSI